MPIVYVIYLKSSNILSQSIKVKVPRFTKENLSSRYGVAHFWSVVAALAMFHLVSSIHFEIEPKQCLSSSVIAAANSSYSNNYTYYATGFVKFITFVQRMDRKLATVTSPFFLSGSAVK